jgi:hypothetical protein
MKFPKWPWFLPRVAGKACPDLATLAGIQERGRVEKEGCWMRERCKKGIEDRDDLENTKRKASRDEYFSMMFPNFDSSSSLRKFAFFCLWYTYTGLNKSSF